MDVALTFFSIQNRSITDLTYKITFLGFLMSLSSGTEQLIAKLCWELLLFRFIYTLHPI